MVTIRGIQYEILEIKSASELSKNYPLFVEDFTKRGWTHQLLVKRPKGFKKHLVFYSEKTNQYTLIN